MPACVLYHGSASPPDDLDSPWRPAGELLPAGPVTASPAVLLVDASLLERLGDSRAVPDDVVVVATDNDTEAALGRRAELSLAGISDAAARQMVLQAACQLAAARFAARQSEEEFQELSRV